jgi:hypothetical protein
VTLSNVTIGAEIESRKKRFRLLTLWRRGEKRAGCGREAVGRGRESHCAAGAPFHYAE